LWTAVEKRYFVAFEWHQRVTTDCRSFDTLPYGIKAQVSCSPDPDLILQSRLRQFRTDQGTTQKTLVKPKSARVVKSQLEPTVLAGSDALPADRGWRNLAVAVVAGLGAIFRS